MEPSQEALEQLLAYINERLHEPLTVNELAARVNSSPFHFARVFHKVVGAPPHEYILQKRISKAREMLAGSDVPIGEISRRVGFCSQAHFTMTFRKRVGVTPGVFRRRRPQGNDSS